MSTDTDNHTDQNANYNYIRLVLMFFYSYLERARKIHREIISQTANSSRSRS